MEIKMNHSDYANFRGLCERLSRVGKARIDLMDAILRDWNDEPYWKELPAWVADSWMLKDIRAAMAVSSLLLDLYKSGQLVLIDDIGEGFVKAADAKATLGIPAALIADIQGADDALPVDQGVIDDKG